MLRAITFDCWGTLIDAAHTTRAERVAHLCRRLPRYAAEGVAKAYDEALSHMRLTWERGFSSSASTVLSLTLDLLGTTLSPDVRASTLRFWEESVLYSPPALVEGALDVLRRLRGGGLWIGLISDTGMTPGRVMRQMFYQRELLHLFDWLTFSDEIGVTKHHAQPFSSTLRFLGVVPEEALHVGDLPETDIRGAHRVGMWAALMLQNTGHREGVAEADLVLERLDELPDALARLAP